MSSISMRQAIMRILAEEANAASTTEFQQNLDDVLVSMQEVLKKIETAHGNASDPTAKVLLAGIHNDFFNVVATSRDYMRKIRGR